MTTRTDTAAPAPVVRGRISLAAGIGVVARREITTKLRSKGFVVPTLIMLGIILLAGLLLPRLGDALSSTSRIAVVPAATEPVAAALGLPGDGTDTGTAGQAAAEQGAAEQGAAGYTLVEVPDEEAARAAVTAGEVDAAVVVDGESPTGWRVIADRDVPTDLVGALAVAPTVQILDPGAPNPQVVSVIGLGFGLVFLLTAMMFGLSIAQSVVEEKQSRIVEILLAALPARTLLAGKIVGNTLLALGQVVAYAAAAFAVMAVNGDRLSLDGLGAPILWFALLFTIAFVMFAALYGAGASLVSRQEDIGSATSPIMFLVMIPYFLVIGFSDNLTVLTVMSYIPFTSPVAVPMRVYLSDIGPAGLLASVAITTLAAIGATLLAAAIYRRSVLKTGAAISWRRALATERG